MWDTVHANSNARADGFMPTMQVCRKWRNIVPNALRTALLQAVWVPHWTHGTKPVRATLLFGMHFKAQLLHPAWGLQQSLRQVHLWAVQHAHALASRQKVHKAQHRTSWSENCEDCAGFKSASFIRPRSKQDAREPGRRKDQGQMGKVCLLGRKFCSLLWSCVKYKLFKSCLCTVQVIFVQRKMQLDLGSICVCVRVRVCVCMCVNSTNISHLHMFYLLTYHLFNLQWCWTGMCTQSETAVLLLKNREGMGGGGGGGIITYHERCVCDMH